MKRNLKAVSLSFAALLSPALLTGCNEETPLYIRVLNAEDYIAEPDDTGAPYIECDIDGDEEIDEESEVFDSVLTAFEAYEGAKLGRKVKIIYDCYDTNETMLSSLKTGKSHYDLICCSDYTVQKMISSGLVKPIEKSAIPNYYGEEGEELGYAPEFIRDKMKGVSAKLPDGSGVILDDYTVGYMWGTLGIVYNAEKVAKDKGIPVEQVHSDMRDWNKCWDKTYKGEMSIKDSMRDTYSMGIMRYFDEAIRQALDDSPYFDEDYFLIQDGSREENFQAYLDSLEEYNPILTEYFNKCDQSTVKEVEKILLELKENVFGFEVDSGKEDIQKGLVGMNLAWSGDATYAITHAKNQWKTTLNYSVPETGGNIWFDSWTLTNEPRTEEEETAALDFLNFFCDPSIASANQDWVGYTSFIAGSDIRDVCTETHDARVHAMFEWDSEAEWYLEAEEEDEEADVDEDFGYVYKEEFSGSTLDTLIYDGEEYPGGWDQYAIDNDWHVVNLEYFFSSEEVYEGFGLDPEDEEAEPSIEFYGESPLDNPYLFFSDEPMITYEGETFVAGSALFAQYPPQDIVPKLAVMRDFGEDNGNVLMMWENVKSNNLPLAGVIAFAIILVAAVIAILVSVLTKRHYRKIKIARRVAVNPNRKEK